MVCECLREALKEEENKGDAVTGDGNKTKSSFALKNTYFLLSRAPSSHFPGPTLMFSFSNIKKRLHDL